MNAIHPAGRLAMAMVVMILLGVTASFIAMLCSNGHDWYVWTRVVRYGWPLLLAVPLMWMVVAVRREADPESNWSESTTLASGLAVAALLVTLFTVTVCAPAPWERIHVTEAANN